MKYWKGMNCQPVCGRCAVVGSFDSGLQHERARNQMKPRIRGKVVSWLQFCKVYTFGEHSILWNLQSPLGKEAIGKSWHSLANPFPRCRKDPMVHLPAAGLKHCDIWQADPPHIWAPEAEREIVSTVERIGAQRKAVGALLAETVISPVPGITRTTIQKESEQVGSRLQAWSTTDGERRMG